jgi:3-deoxy-manno-octulosonate cytidylyltransferase (CMP-KDO synthetase)
MSNNLLLNPYPSNPNTIAIIPARMGSSRFPGKPMAEIHGIPMIGHVYFRTKMCPLLYETYVATCDQEISDYIISIGGKAVMTADTHERCSDRTAEAMLKIESEIGRKVDIVVMVQGDEPMVTPEMIEYSIVPMLKDSSIQVVNLMARIKSVEEFEDPNEVKVVTDLQSNALYFSREPIPSRKKDKKDVPMMKQVCIIPFKREFLLKFNALNSTPLEIIESVDMMRVIEHGYKVKMVFSDTETYSVDTSEDLAKVEKLIKKDSLIRRYAK